MYKRLKPIKKWLAYHHELWIDGQLHREHNQTSSNIHHCHLSLCTDQSRQRTSTANRRIHAVMNNAVCFIKKWLLVLYVVIKFTLTSLCSAASFACGYKHSTARICCWAPCCDPVLLQSSCLWPGCVKAAPPLLPRDRQMDGHCTVTQTLLKLTIIQIIENFLLKINQRHIY